MSARLAVWYWSKFLLHKKFMAWDSKNSLRRFTMSRSNVAPFVLEVFDMKSILIQIEKKTNRDIVPLSLWLHVPLAQPDCCVRLLVDLNQHPDTAFLRPPDAPMTKNGNWVYWTYLYTHIPDGAAAGGIPLKKSKVRGQKNWPHRVPYIYQWLTDYC